MIMPVKYDPETVAKAIKMRHGGAKWSVLEATFGPGITGACNREMARLRKQRSRATTEQRLEVPLPAGTAAALARVCEAASDEPVALLCQQIHKLDELRQGSPELFRALTAHRTDVAAVIAKYLEAL